MYHPLSFYFIVFKVDKVIQIRSRFVLQWITLRFEDYLIGTRQSSEETGFTRAEWKKMKKKEKRISSIFFSWKKVGKNGRNWRNTSNANEVLERGSLTLWRHTGTSRLICIYENSGILQDITDLMSNCFLHYLIFHEMH